MARRAYKPTPKAGLNCVLVTDAEVVKSGNTSNVEKVAFLLSIMPPPLIWNRTFGTWIPKSVTGLSMPANNGTDQFSWVVVCPVASLPLKLVNEAAW